MHHIKLPLVSVVMPVYNADSFLETTIKSIISQDYPNLEIIAIDDGSTDHSSQILAEHSDLIRVLHQSNSGSACARNVGINHARGEYIAFIDADDLWHPLKIRLQVEHLEANKHVGLVYCGWQVIEDDDEVAIKAFVRQDFNSVPTRVVKEQSGWIYCKLLLDCIVHTSATIVRKSVLDTIGFFDESFRQGQDYDYWFRISRVTECHKLNLLLSVYRIHQHSITQKPMSKNYGALVLEKALSAWGTRGPDGSTTSAFAIRNHLSWKWHCFGILHLEHGDRKIAKTSFGKGLQYAPWRLGCWKDYVKAVLMNRRSPAKDSTSALWR